MADPYGHLSLWAAAGGGDDDDDDDDDDDGDAGGAGDLGEQEQHPQHTTHSLEFHQQEEDEDDDDEEEDEEAEADTASGHGEDEEEDEEEEIMHDEQHDEHHEEAEEEDEEEEEEDDDEEEDEEDHLKIEKNNPAKLLASKKRPLTAGFAHLQRELVLDSSDIGGGSALTENAKSVLRRLLEQHMVLNLVEPAEAVHADDGGMEDDNDAILRRALAFKKRKEEKPKILQLLDKNMSEDDILTLANQGKLSLLGSLLQCIEQQQQQDSGGGATTGNAVTARHCIQTCFLAVPPGKVPGQLDAKEAVLAALHFLSSECGDPSASNALSTLPSLPLIRPVTVASDLEKQSYEKVGTWTLSDTSNDDDGNTSSMLEKITALEHVFWNQDYALEATAVTADSNCHPLKWLARERFVPTLIKPGSADWDMLLRKGHPPASATGKVKKLTPAQRASSGKATTASAATLTAAGATKKTK